ncbi:MAG TPA: hypothetical protein VK687_05840, partial [Bryobacteraceae bacterium]|nr:hypothetical protein [Bryobacteraceae bacterium]
SVIAGPADACTHSKACFHPSGENRKPFFARTVLTSTVTPLPLPTDHGRVGVLNCVDRKYCRIPGVAKTQNSGLIHRWPKIASGVEVIVWSHLASWDGARLAATTDRSGFDLHWQKIDQKFGRWLCWLAFGIGAEGIVKEAFDLKKYPLGHFGKCHPWGTVLGMPNQHIAAVSHAIHQLATEVRNRDAHEYVPGVRDKDFPDVALHFVPALNQILDCLGEEVPQRIAKYYRNGSSMPHT